MPFLCRFCGLFFSFCFSHLPSMAPQLPSCGDVTFSVCCLPLFQVFGSCFFGRSGTGAAIIGVTPPNWLTDEGLADGLAAWNPDFVGSQSDFPGPVFFSFSGMGSLSFLALLSSTALLCLSCPGCWRSAPFFSSPSMSSEGSASLDPCACSSYPPLPPRPRLLISWTTHCPFLFRLGVS